MCESLSTCKLCGENKELKESHIIPKFIYDWVKSTSPTSYFRSSDNVDKREQDGPKQKLLCGDCELKFSKWEEALSKELFKKIANYQKPKTEFTISNDSLLAILSIFWRKLVTLDFTRNNDWTEEDKVVIKNLAQTLKNEILGNNISKNVFLIPVTNTLINQYSKFDRARYYFERSIDSFNIRFLDDPHRWLALVKLPFMYLYIISDEWKNNEIDITLEITQDLQFCDQDYTPSIMKGLIKDSLVQFNQTLLSINDQELAKLTSDIKSNPNFQNTGAYKSLILRN